MAPGLSNTEADGGPPLRSAAIQCEMLELEYKAGLRDSAGGELWRTTGVEQYTVQFAALSEKMSGQLTPFTLCQFSVKRPIKPQTVPPLSNLVLKIGQWQISMIEISSGKCLLPAIFGHANCGAQKL